MKGTVADNAPIVPISAQLRYNIDALVEYICTKIPVPVRDFETAPKLIVIRSFDVNKPGAEVGDLKGGVAGGSLLKGVLKVSPPPIIFLTLSLSLTHEGRKKLIKREVSEFSWVKRLKLDLE